MSNIVKVTYYGADFAAGTPPVSAPFYLYNKTTLRLMCASRLV